MSLVDVFAGAVLPIIAIAGVGFVLGRRIDVEAGPLNTVAVYVLAPALVFHSLASTEMGGATIARVAVGIVVAILTMVAVGEVTARLVGEQEPYRSALVLVAAFPNAGNLGIPLSEFSFGTAGRSTAILFFVTEAVLMYTVGVYVASRGGGGGGREGIRRVFSIPLVYAVAAALAARYFHLVPPDDSTAMSTLELVGEAAIPIMLLLLGIELSNTDYGRAVRRIGVPALLKIGLAPAVGVGIAILLGFSDPTVGRVFVLELATPSAITPLILTLEFGPPTPEGDLAVSEYVSACVLTTTLVGIPVLTVLIFLLQSGVVI